MAVLVLFEVSLSARHGAYWQALRMILPAWFDNLLESFFHKEVQFNRVLPICENQLSSCWKTLMKPLFYTLMFRGVVDSLLFALDLFFITSWPTSFLRLNFCPALHLVGNNSLLYSTFVKGYFLHKKQHHVHVQYTTLHTGSKH